eukprot:265176-Pyramimonas_sp.AAC.1
MPIARDRRQRCALQTAPRQQPLQKKCTAVSEKGRFQKMGVPFQKKVEQFQKKGRAVSEKAWEV